MDREHFLARFAGRGVQGGEKGRPRLSRKNFDMGGLALQARPGLTGRSGRPRRSPPLDLAAGNAG